MPAKTASLRITETYRGRLVAIRKQAQTLAKQTWAKIPSDSLDNYQPSVLGLQIAELQRGAARLGAAYVSAFVASELGEAPVPPVAVASQTGEAFGGRALGRALLGPMLGVKQAIGQGKDPAQALAEGGRELVKVVGLATDQAGREAQRVAMDLSPNIDDWRRAVKGTCDACLSATAEGTFVPAGEPLEIHPNCECVAEPNVTTGINSWAGIRWDERVSEQPREGEVAPERTRAGDFVLYHGTSKAGAESILRNRVITPDDLNFVGLATTPSQAQSYAAIKGGPVLRVYVSKEELQQFIAKHEIGGTGRNQLLFRPPRTPGGGGPLKPEWEGIRV